MLNYATEKQIALAIAKLPKIGDWIEIDPDGTKAQCIGYKVGTYPNHITINADGTGFHSGLGKETLLLEQQLSEIKADFDLYDLR